jgi:formate/nitrite transporter FocA (FNT family)
MHMQVVHNAYSPKETTELCSRAGVAKANMRIDKIFFSSFMAGCLLAFACAASLSTQTSPWYQDNAPGLIRMIGAIIFPFGLVTIVLTGADLCTGSFMFTTISALHRRLSVVKMLMHWFITFFGNLAGSLFVMGLITG